MTSQRPPGTHSRSLDPLASGMPSAAPRVTLESLLEQFTREVRGGAFPSIAQYASQNPELAEEIEELFPLVEDLERCKAVQEAEHVRQNFPDEFPLRQLGDYTIVREVGRGGMGIVFEAIQFPVKRPVAIKLLPERNIGNRPQAKERFHREAITIAQFRHQNIVPIYSFGEHEGYYFYVMQLVRGVSLDWIIGKLRDSAQPVSCAMIREQYPGDKARESAESAGNQPFRGIARNSWKTFAKIGIQVAVALDYAHRRQVLHHDIKPANLLVNDAGRVVVTDFGGCHQATTSGAAPGVAGTLRYMAPECLRGQSDARSDVYSLGATLYELVTQTPLFEAPDRLRLAELILNSPPRPPRQLVRNLPPDLEAIILTALARSPDSRYPTAKALAEDLLRFVNQQAIHGGTPEK